MYKLKRLNLLLKCSFIMLLCLMYMPTTVKADMITYQLNNVYLGFHSNEMTGTFEWTYDAEDFEGGSGIFTDLYIPWYTNWFEADPNNRPGLNINIETKSIEFSLDGNIHGHGVDITLSLVDGDQLSLTNLSSVIDTNPQNSKYEITLGGPTFSGAIINGTIDAVTTVPEPSTIALLGISLMGLVGTGVVRKIKRKV